MWVFGYGSLVWNPEFPVAEQVVATLSGYARSFCMRSIHHRGSVEAPGLVLALDASPAARCTGVALRVASGHHEATLAALRERELVSAAYVETVVPLTLSDGRTVEALAYVIEKGHVQYCGGMPLEDQARIIAEARGGRGPNDEYLFNTTRQLTQLGIGDPDLDWLAARVDELNGTRP